MNRPGLILFLPQALFSACAVVLGVWLKAPWPVLAALGVLTAAITSVSRQQQSSKWNTALAWTCTAAVAGSLLLEEKKVHLDDPGYAALGFLNATALMLAGARLTDGAARTWWKALGMTWALAVGFFWLEYSYRQNFSVAFHIGLLINVVLLILSRILFRLPAFAIQAVHTLILLLVVLPAVDCLVRPSSHRSEETPGPRQRYYRARTQPGSKFTSRAVEICGGTF
jgi:hypothetical protein